MKKTISLVLVLALGLTAEVANADFIWGTPTNLGPTVNSSADDAAPSISADGLQLYFIDWEVFRPGGYGLSDIWVTTRETTEDDWGTPVNLGPTVNSSAREGAMSISADGLSLFFGSNRPGGYGGWDLWVTTRATTEDDWGTPVNLGPTVNSSYLDAMGSISADGLSFFFTSDRPGGLGSWDIYVTTRATKEDDWGTPVNLGPTVNSTAHDCLPDISADGLALFFSDYLSGPYRPGGFGLSDIWVTTRPTTDDPWGTPVNLGPTVNSSARESAMSISADGLSLFFGSNRPGGHGSGDIWQVPIIPVVDFNGDGVVNFKDFCELAHYWSADESSVDIGPLPFGDYRVDYKDLAVFTDYWLKGSPPDQASNPYPANYTEEVDINVDLSWTAGAGAISYDVYFGMSSPGTFQGNQTDTTFDPGTMVHGSTYNWRIDAVNAWGKTAGTVWNFTTVYSDFQAKNPNPSNGAIGVNTTADLSWTAGVGATSHDVYFGTSNPPPFLLNQATTTFDPGTMAYSTKYYWRIDEVDAYGTTTGTVWSFTTMMSPPPPPPT
jgi:hypothetical protein